MRVAGIPAQRPVRAAVWKAWHGNMPATRMTSEARNAEEEIANIPGATLMNRIKHAAPRPRHDTIMNPQTDTFLAFIEDLAADIDDHESSAADRARRQFPRLWVADAA